MAHKEIRFVARSEKDLSKLPADAQKKFFDEFDAIQRGEDATDAKPLQGVPAGIYEIRVWAKGGTFRAAYVAKFEDAIYVLHVWQKKGKTEKADIDLIVKRFKDLTRR